RYQFDEISAFAKQFLRMRLLKISQTDLRRGDVRGDGQYRNVISLAVEQSIDQMQVSRPATARAHRKITGYRRLRARRESRGLLVAHVHPLDATQTAQAIVQTIQTVAGNAPNAFDAC